MDKTLISAYLRMEEEGVSVKVEAGEEVKIKKEEDAEGEQGL